MNKQIKSTLIMLTAAIIWGFAFSAQVMVDNNVLGNFSFNGVRFLLGALSLIPVIYIFERGRLSAAEWKKTAMSASLAGLMLFIASALQQFGISMNHNAGKAGFITGLYTVLVPFFGMIFFRRKIGARTWLAALLAVCGLFLLSAADGMGSINRGDVVVFIGAFFWAGHILVIDRFVGEVSPIKFSAMQFAVCGALNLVFAAFTENITLSGIAATAVPILYTGIMSTAVAYTCQVIGQRDADPNFAAIVLSTECVFSAVGGAIVLHEVMTLRGYVGCALMFAGIVLSQLKKKGGAEDAA